jgi:alpha-glucoside transport system permease protein
MSVTGPLTTDEATTKGAVSDDPITTLSRAGQGRGGAVGEVRQGGWLIRITIVAIVILWSIPTLGVLITSFRAEELVNTSGWWTALAHPFRAAEWTLENYRTAIDAQGFGNAFLNSLAVAIPATVIPITIAAFAAYAFSWMDFRGRFVMFVAVVGLLVVPLQMALIPILRLFTRGATLGGYIVFPDLDLNQSFLGIWLAHTAFGLPLAIYLLRNYIGSLPSSIIESARIDGADHFTIFWRLIVPLSVPALAAFAIFQFMWVWNDLLVAYVLLGGAGRNQVLTVALRNLVGQTRENWQLLTAAAFISMALPLAVFFSLQRYFIRGLTAGSVKG